MNLERRSGLERRAYRSFVEDGLGDVLFGAFLLGFGLTVATDIDYLPVVLGVVVVPLWRRLRRTVIEPRRGYVRLAPARLSRLRRGRMILKAMSVIVVGAFGLVAFGPEHWAQWVREYRVVLPGLLLGIPTLVAGVVFEVPRFYGYAGLLWLTSVLSYFGGLPVATGLLASGGSVVGVGLLVFVRFRSQYPVPSHNGDQPNV